MAKRQNKRVPTRLEKDILASLLELRAVTINAKKEYVTQMKGYMKRKEMGYLAEYHFRSNELDNVLCDIDEIIAGVQYQMDNMKKG